MFSPHRSAHAFSPTRSPRHTQQPDNMGTSVNRTTAFSNSRNSSSYNFRHSEDEDNGATDLLDISNIDHEAIRNDPELRELSRNPAAFNHVSHSGGGYHSMKHTHWEADDEHENDYNDDDDDDEGYGEYTDVEMLVRNPMEEKRQRQLAHQMSNVSSVQNVPVSPRQRLRPELSSASTAFDLSEADRLEKKIADSLQFSDSKYQGFYTVLKPIVFLFFMAFWITKEPIIRTVTFFTMVVSTVIVDPLFYLWSCISSNNTNTNSSTHTRKNITHWCTAALLGVLSIIAVRSFTSNEAILPAWKFSLPFSTLSSPLSSLDQARIKTVNNEYKTLSLKLGKFQEQFQAYTQGVDSEHSKLWSAIHHQQTQINALRDKLDTELRQLFASQEQQLPGNILVSTNKDNNFELPASFYKHLHNADSWNQFLKQNKAAIDKYLQGHMDDYFSKQEKNGAIIHKDTFLSLITNDLLKRTTKWGKHDAATSPSLNQLVASAVEKYHQDMLDTADFALESRGGRVIFTKTSATFDPAGPWKRRLRTSMGLSVMMRPPEMALRPDVHAGACWSMAGQQGSLGITLSEPVFIQGFTVEHPSKNILLHDIDSAPKDLEIYGISNYGVYGKEEVLVSLGQIYYDINSNKPVQTFTINSNPTEAYRAVLIKIKSNWGNSDYTDLYRIRVHGTPL